MRDRQHRQHDVTEGPAHDVADVRAAAEHYRTTVARWQAEDTAWRAQPTEQITNTEKVA